MKESGIVFVPTYNDLLYSNFGFESKVGCDSFMWILNKVGENYNYVYHCLIYRINA